VATHSGYFLVRQFLAFAGGDRATRFGRKLESYRHARKIALPKHRTVYHLFARQLYRQLGREKLGSCRNHELEFIETRLSVLDFVLANPDVSYLGSEGDKLSYFCRDLAIDLQHLPRKSYPGRGDAPPVARYFLDRFPMFFEEALCTQRMVTFTFIQGSEASLSAFVHHLAAYTPLFRELREFRFLYLARTEAHFLKAGELFNALVAVPLESHPAEDLLRYFAIQKAWDLCQYASLSEDDLVFRSRCQERFAGERFGHFYRAWKADRIADSDIRKAFAGHPLPHVTHFAARILERAAPPRKAEGPASRIFEASLTGGTRMSIIKKAPAMITREFCLEEPVSLLLDDYARFIESSPDHVLNAALKKTLWRDQDYRNWREQKKSAQSGTPAHEALETDRS